MFVARVAVVNKFREMNCDDKAIEEAERAGFDLSLVDSNLRLTYDDRAARHEGALAFALQLRKAGRDYYAQSTRLAEPAR